MNPKNLIIGILLVGIGAALVPKLFAADTQTQSTYEYVTIRWAGRDNTHVIRSGGRVEFIGPCPFGKSAEQGCEGVVVSLAR